MSSQLHILIVPSWYPTFEHPLNGIFFKEQAQALQKAGVRVGVIYPELWSLRRLDVQGIWERHFQIVSSMEEGVRTYRLKGWSLPARVRLSKRFWASMVKTLVRYYCVQQGNPHLLHAHCALWGGVATMKLGLSIPYVVTEHSSIYFEGIADAEDRKITAEVFKNSERVISVSRSAGEFLVKEGLLAEEKLRIIPNLIRTDFFTPPTSPPEPSTTFRFLHVAFLENIKKTDLLIKAFALAFPDDSTVSLEIGGDGPNRQALERLVQELGLSKRIKFLGLLARNEVRAAMWRANVFVLTSLYETFGVVLIEALSTGLPVISTACGGPSDIITPQVGKLIPVDDIEALMRALQWMRSSYKSFDPQVLRKYAINRFSASLIIQQLIELYQEQIAGSAEPSSGKLGIGVE